MEPILPKKLTKAYSYVRISSGPQKRGDGLRRQLERSTEYARNNGLELDKDFQLADEGVSAFKGENIERGALGRFLDAVKDGTIPPGSYLIIESLDRLSRQHPQTAWGVFSDILRRGINIVTLVDGQLYPAGAELKFEQIIYTLMVMARARDESFTKSDRQKISWSKKQASAATKKMTSMCPAWLQLAPDRSKFLLRNDRAAVVKLIFQLSADGYGIYKICGKLNSESVPTFGDSKGWHGSYVSKILSNRAVLGELTLNARSRTASAAREFIPNYYPPVVEEELFARSALGRRERIVRGRGRTGEHLSSLFSGLAYCQYCSAKLKYLNKGPKPKGGSYLLCDRAHRKLNCVAKAWNYKNFETSFLRFVAELDFARHLHMGEQAEKRTSLEGQVAILQSKQAGLLDAQQNLLTAIEQSGALPFLIERAKVLDKQLHEIDAELATATIARDLALGERDVINSASLEMSGAISNIQNATNSDNLALRVKVKALLQSVVKTIVVASVGSGELIRQEIERLRKLPNQKKAIKQLEDDLNDTFNMAIPYFRVDFKNGTSRIVAPNPDNPSSFYRQFVGHDDDLNFYTNDASSPSGKAKLIVGR